MIIRVLPTQIPKVWEHIKYAVSTVLGLSGKRFQEFNVRLIHQLLTDRAQCFIRMDKDRHFQAMVVTRIIDDYYTKERSLLFELVYSVEAVNLDVWKSDLDFVMKFARSVGCKRVEGCTAVPKLQNILSNLGFVEKTVTFSISC